MKKSKLLSFLKRPNLVFLALLYFFTILFCAASIFIVIVQTENSVLSYITFALAALSLGYSTYTVVINVSSWKRKINHSLHTHAFTAKLLENYEFKTIVFSTVSLAVTIAFTLMNLVSAIRYRSVWYGALSAYYFMLILFRGGVLLSNAKRKKSLDVNEYEIVKWKIYRASGIFLFIIEIAMAFAVTQMMLSDRPTPSGEIMAIANAAYAFYKMFMAIYNLIRAKRLSDPITQALRNLNLADACMSIVSLTVLLLTTFSESDIQTKMLYLKSSVGFSACLFLIIMAIIMIVRATKTLKFFKESSENSHERK